MIVPSRVRTVLPRCIGKDQEVRCVLLVFGHDLVDGALLSVGVELGSPCWLSSKVAKKPQQISLNLRTKHQPQSKLKPKHNILHLLTCRGFAPNATTVFPKQYTRLHNGGREMEKENAMAVY